MNSAQIMDMAIDQTNVNITDYPYTRVVKYLNQVKNDLFSYIITGISEDYQWDIWTTTSVANQSEYVLPEAASDTEGNLKINGVSINYNGETYDDGTFKYIKANEVKLNSLPYSWNYYKNNQSANTPIFYVADKSIFVAPHPDSSQAGVNRIELKGIKSIPDYDEDTTESNIKIPLYLHDVLVQGVLPYIHKGEGRKDEASFERKIYETERDLAVKKITSRVQTPFYLSYPEDTINNDYILTLD